MKITEKRQVEEEFTIALECDWCRKRVNRIRWARGHEIDDMYLYRAQGFYDDSKVVSGADLCPDCWDKLMEYLKSQGCRVNGS